MKKILLLLLICSSFLISSCSGQKKLERALEAINETSYTIKHHMKVVVSTSYQGQSMKETVEMDMDMEADPNQSYTVVTMNNEKAYVYGKRVGDDLKYYLKEADDSEWEKVESDDSIQSFTDTAEILDIETEDVFVKEDDVWIGDCEKINNELKEYMSEFAEEFVGAGITLSSARVDKYNITLDGKDLSKVEVVMSMSMSMHGVTMNMIITMNMEFSKIGETTVTVPLNLPQ